MLKLSLRSREELKKKKMRILRLPSINVKRTRNNLRLNKRHKDREKKKNVKSSV